MDIRELHIFMMVAQTRSISKAAQQLGYVQSNVTARIQRLEEDVDAVLFYRRKQGMILTPAGKTLLDYAERVVRLVEEAQRAIQETDQVKGTLTLGSMETSAAVRLPSVLALFHRTYPDVDLMLTTGTSEELIAGVLDYAFDMAFVAGSVIHPDLEQQQVFDEELVLVTDQEVETLDALHQQNLLVFRQGCTYRDKLEHLMRERGLLPRKIMEFGTVEAILGCVAAGMGVTLFPHSVIMRLQHSYPIKFHTLPPTTMYVPTMLIWRTDVFKTKAMEAFVELMQSSERL